MCGFSIQGAWSPDSDPLLWGKSVCLDQRGHGFALGLNRHFEDTISQGSDLDCSQLKWKCTLLRYRLRFFASVFSTLPCGGQWWGEGGMLLVAKVRLPGDH